MNVAYADSSAVVTLASSIILVAGLFWFYQRAL
jgi:hypothetical protein